MLSSDGVRIRLCLRASGWICLQMDRRNLLNMRKSIGILSALACAMMLTACGGDVAVRTAAGTDVPETVVAGNVSFRMVSVPGGTFAMGRTPSGTKVTGAKMHQVVLYGYSISEQPVSQELWTAVMGTPSGNSAIADMVSYDDCLKFLGKLTKMSGIPFSLPTEAQWENAAAEGLADVNADLMEWCADSFTEEFGGDSLALEPLCTEKTDLRVVRDRKSRSGELRYVKKPRLGFRLAVNTVTDIPQDVMTMIVDKTPERELVDSDETISVGGVSFKMIGVAGGTFYMGASPEQGKMAGDDEKPVHEVTLSGFEIGQTEVTAGLWNAVMGSLPYKNSADEPDKPVVNVSWYDCQMFIIRLNRLTGRKFRLPTEAEWEYAAKGGLKSSGDQFSGGMYVSQVAAYIGNAASQVMSVRSFRPNELGIYDMSGNAWEWCQDSKYDYADEEVTDPYYNLRGELRIMRGGSAASKWDACRVSNRSALPACSVKSTFGFRLAL